MGSRVFWFGLDFQQHTRQALIFCVLQSRTIGMFIVGLLLPLILLGFLMSGASSSVLYNDPVKILIMGSVYYTTILGGFRSAILSLWSLSRERSVLRAVTEKAKLLSGNGLELDSRDGGNVFLKFDTPTWTDDRLASVRMIQRIWLQACEMRYEPVGIVTSSYAGELTAGTRSLRSWQAVGIRLGILGTFIGLLAILGALATGLAKSEVISDPKALFSLVAQITDRLALAFGTSVAGLGAAVFLQIELEMVLKRQEAVVVRVFEAAVRDVQHTCSLGTLRRSLLSSVDALNARIVQHAEQVSAQSNILKHEFEGLSKLVTEERNGIGKRLAELAGVSSAVREQISVASNLNQAHKNLIDTFDSFRQGIDGAIREHLTNSSEVLKKGISSMLAAMGRVTATVDARASESLLETLDRINETLLLIERRERWIWLRTLLAVVAAMLLVITLFAAGLLYGRVDLQKAFFELLLQG